MEINKYISKPLTSFGRGKPSSVHYGYDNRFNKALEQSKIKAVPVKRIIDLTNEFLNAVDITTIQNNVVNEKFIKNLTGEIFSVNQIDSNKSFYKLFYKNLKDKFNLNDSRDIVWMKFSREENGHNKLGVVATRNDINFDLPISESEYNDKTRSGDWKYTTSGILLNYIKKEWDESFVLVFPLAEIPSGLTRHDIETGIGNYLIANNVPIIDFYSHNF